jgi:isochorismate pyruvate lyase
MNTGISGEPPTTSGPVRAFIDPAYTPRFDDLGALRARIDALDAQIVALLAERAACVVDATRFKRDAHQAAAPARQAQVFARVRALAAAHASACGFAPLPDVVESAYRVLVAGLVAHEQALLAQTTLIEETQA